MPLHGHKKAKLIAALTFIPALALADYGSVRVDEMTSVLDGGTSRDQINDWPPVIGKRTALKRGSLHAVGPARLFSVCCA